MGELGRAALQLWLHISAVTANEAEGRTRGSGGVEEGGALRKENARFLRVWGTWCPVLERVEGIAVS